MSARLADDDAEILRLGLVRCRTPDCRSLTTPEVAARSWDRGRCQLCAMTKGEAMLLGLSVGRAARHFYGRPWWRAYWGKAGEEWWLSEEERKAKREAEKGKGKP